VIDALAPLAHQTTWLAVSAERAVSRAMGGSCSMPLAAYATLASGTLTIDAAWGDPEGHLELVSVRASASVTDLGSARALGERVATDLRSRVVAKGGSVPLPGEAAGQG
jgi:hydroxymethylbilane synthase